MFTDPKLNEQLKKAEEQFYGRKNLNFFQKNYRLKVVSKHNKEARKIPEAVFGKV